ncbi:hypothetical protein [Haloferax marisrubri]|uniref:Uncharacterized protein n=1 Tax=Haloferax marisrubri TaxID=1544719 RepID=A0A2P4NSN0_9EURY|nr:hypothetical protein [Haloferax marisrubri]POG56156.1 hypothetical protein AUR65_006485 [Haloferax marisrubri]
MFRANADRGVGREDSDNNDHYRGDDPNCPDDPEDAGGHIDSDHIDSDHTDNIGDAEGARHRPRWS